MFSIHRNDFRQRQTGCKSTTNDGSSACPDNEIEGSAISIPDTPRRWQNASATRMRYVAVYVPRIPPPSKLRSRKGFLTDKVVFIEVPDTLEASLSRMKGCQTLTHYRWGYKLYR